jgi:hypothetical protein
MPYKAHTTDFLTPSSSLRTYRVADLTTIASVAAISIVSAATRCSLYIGDTFNEQ